MEKQRNDLQPFNMERVNEIREIRGERDSIKSFWNELEIILKNKDPTKNEWERMDNDEVVKGEVWSHPIGEFYYKNTVHIFSYLYVESQELAIDLHGHYEPANNGKQTRKVKEWYIFSNGKYTFCGKDCKHRLFNRSNGPIYVLSVKVKRRGHKKNKQAR